MMNLSIGQLVFDCADAEKLAGFWSQVLDRPVDPGANPFFATVGVARSEGGDPSARSLGLMFLQVPEAKQVKNRLHLDLTGLDWQGEVARVIELGAVQIGEHQEYGTHWVTLLDPEGNEFDLGAGVDVG
jgi:hypothetical protein